MIVRPRRRPVALVRLGRIRGVPILAAPSWLLVLLVLTLVYAPVIRDFADGVGRAATYASAFGFMVALVASVAARQVAQLVTWLALGYRVERVVLALLGGVSETQDEPRSARDELLIALSGPAASVVLAAGAVGGYLATEPSTLPAVLLAFVAWTNALLAGFNLLPGLPLDGGHVVRAIARAVGAADLTATRIAAQSGRVVAVGVALAAFALNAVSRDESAFVTSVLAMLVAIFLWFGAVQSLKVADLLARLPQVRVRDLLRPGLLVPADLSVAEALRRVWDGQARGLVLLDSAERPTAIVDELLIGAVPPDRRPWTPVSEVAHPLEPGRTVPVDVEADALLEHMRRNPAPEYLALDGDGAPAGIIATIDFARELKGTA